MFDLEEIGLSKAELQERVIDSMASRLLESISENDEGQGSYPTALQMKLQDFCKKAINDAVSAMAEKHILPNVTAYVENLTLQEHNKWGEKSGKSLTFIEYLVERANTYMQEKVDYQGKSKEESGSYSFDGRQTRITYIVHQHMRHSIESAVRKMLESANAQISGGIQETVKLSLERITKNIKIGVEVKD